MGLTGRRMCRSLWKGGLAAGVFVALVGCSHLHPKLQEKYVYVTAREAFLRDRVAAVSNRTGEVTNGEKLVVLERSRRFVRVRTPKGEEGWIEEKAVADEELANKFESLRVKHVLDPTVASASARDEVYLHIAPGRETDRFFRLAEGDKLNLLKRASVEKVVPPGSVKPSATPATAGKGAAAKGGAPAVAEPVAPAYEDWWLVRDAKGDTGWIYSHLIDVDAPDALARYAEGQRYVAAYVLAMADDPDSGVVSNGVTVTSIAEYVTVLSPYLAGLPYDFNQVRVFTWNSKMHRYETAHRDRDVAGYLPVTLKKTSDPYGKGADAAVETPGFTYTVLAAGESLPTPNAEGELEPGKMVTKTYRLVGNQCRRVVAPGKAPEEFHLVEEKKAPLKKKK